MTHITLSAIFGDIDTPKLQQVPVTMYTDDNTPWPMHNLDNRLRGKAIKMLSHRLHDEDIHVWIDGNVQLKMDMPGWLASMIGDADIVIQRHPQRTSIYQEADYICNQIEGDSKYLKQRYAPHAIKAEIEMIGTGLQGLYACGIFARKNNARVNAAFEEWYMLSHLYANFDQIMFVYIVHKYKLDVTAFDMGNFYDNKFYTLVKHDKVV